MARTCRPPNTLRFGSYSRLLETLPEPGRISGDLFVDLKSLRWIEALPIAVLVAYLKDHLHRNPASKNAIGVPQKYAYLQRMDFFRAVGARVKERFQRRDPTGRFVPVREVQTGAEVVAAADEIVRTLRVDDADAANTLRHSVGEVLDNVFVHARSNVHAVICAQHFPNARRSQVAIVDTGIGFLGSFQENVLFREAALDDPSAIALGLEPFVTSKPSTGMPTNRGMAAWALGSSSWERYSTRSGGGCWCSRVRRRPIAAVRGCAGGPCRRGKEQSWGSKFPMTRSSRTMRP
jgi:hypothetical protein